MDQNNSTYLKDIVLLNEYFKGTRKMKQDTVFHSSQYKLKKKYLIKKKIYEEDAHSHFFSNMVSNKLISNNPVSYVSTVLLKSELKKLKNGKYFPDIVLDLHGLNQYQSKKELGKLITICYKKNFFCFSIIHGHGKDILKYQIPIWLSQHPDIIAFHQAPKKFGNNAALLVLIKPDT